MNSDDFEWDPVKAARNAVLHRGVTFQDAATALQDPYVITSEDCSARGEQRFVALGADAKDRLLNVIYTGRVGKQRIISAWKANSTQRKQYERQFG